MIIIDDKEVDTKESELSKFLEETTKELEKTDIELNLSKKIDEISSEAKVNRDKELEVSVNKINYIDSVTKLDKIKKPVSEMKSKYNAFTNLTISLFCILMFNTYTDDTDFIVTLIKIIIIIIIAIVAINCSLKFKVFRSLDNIIKYSENNLHAELYNIGNITGICPLNLKEYRLLENFLDLKDKCFMFNAFYHSKSKLSYIHINLESNKIKVYSEGNANSINFIRDIKIDKLEIASEENTDLTIKVSCRKIKITLPKEWFKDNLKLEELAKIKIEVKN